MGCYGIGLGRIIATLIENNIIVKNNKIKGFALPVSIAPYKLYIIYNENNKTSAFELYDYLINNNTDVIIDDRENMTLGNRINDVSLHGTPKLVVLGNRYDGINYEIENLKDNSIINATKENIIARISIKVLYFKRS